MGAAGSMEISDFNDFFTGNKELELHRNKLKGNYHLFLYIYNKYKECLSSTYIDTFPTYDDALLQCQILEKETKHKPYHTIRIKKHHNC